MSETLVLRVCPIDSEGDLWCDVTFRYEPPSGPPGFYNGSVDIESIKDSNTEQPIEVTDSERARLEEHVADYMREYA